MKILQAYKKKSISWSVSFLIFTCITIFSSQALAVEVIRNLPKSIVPGKPFSVTLTVVDDGNIGIGIIEQLPSGYRFSEPDTLNKPSCMVDLNNNRLAITFLSAGSVTYEVIAENNSNQEFKGIYIDLLERSSEKDTPRKRFHTIGDIPLHDTLLPKDGKAVSLVGANSIPGDNNGDNILTKTEFNAFTCGYLLGTGEGSLDDVCDAAWVFTQWDGKPKKIADMADRSITLYRPIERIITTNPDNSMIIIALGLGEMLVGTDECTVGSCICPRLGNRKSDPKASPDCWTGVCGGNMDHIPQTSTRKEVNHELMTTLLPDVIFETTFWATRADDLGLKVGSPVIVAGADFTVNSWLHQIKLMGQALDSEEKAEQLVKLCNQKIELVTSITNRIPKAERPRVYFAPRGARKGFYDPKEGRDFTRTYRVYEPLQLAGGLNVANEIVGNNVNVSIEQIIAWNPDYIFVGCSEPKDKGVEFLKEAPELASITAIMKSQIFNVMYPHCRGRPIPRNIVNTMLMAKLLYPDHFRALDLEKEGNEIYNAFLGVNTAFTEYAEYLEFPLDFFINNKK